MKLATILKEVFTYHYSGGKEVDTSKTHGSDNIVIMRGRGTGHFGSGLYFSTYNCEGFGAKTDYEKNYGKHSDYQNKQKEFTKVEKNLYRVDFDLYKNLYRVESAEKGDYLFKTLKMINELFYSLDYYLKYKDYSTQKFSSKYLIIKNNLHRLGLKCPSPKEFISMVKKASEDLNSLLNREKEKVNSASFSTRIMEYNGYNGVNVSGIREYDNTTHGSVIYDMSKIDKDFISPAKNVSLFCTRLTYSKTNRDPIIHNYGDVISNILSGDKIGSNLEKINNLPEKTQTLIFKKYDKFIPSYYLEKLSDFQKKIYFNTLSGKIKNGNVEDEPSKYDLAGIVDNKRLDIIYDPNNKIEGITLLVWAIKQLDYRDTDDIINNIPKNRSLSDEEQEIVNEYK